MLRIVIKFLLSAAIVVSVSEIAKRSSTAGSLLASLPLVSVLSLIWLYQDTGDIEKVATLSTDIFWLVIPSLVMFVVLPVLLRRGVGFYPALGASIAAMLICVGFGAVLVQKFRT